MDTSHGLATSALSAITHLVREHSLYQAVLSVVDRLQERYPDLIHDQLYELIEFQASPSLGFPSSDVERVEFFEESGMLRARIRLNLIRLVGAGSPLPAFYAEQAWGEGEEQLATRDFLDLFHHRLQRLMLPIWRKYRYHSRFQRGASDSLSAQLFALIGLGGVKIREATELNWNRLLPYLGLLSLRAHSATLLEAVLRYYFKHADLHVEQWIERRVDIPDDQLGCLGSTNSSLGSDMVLGERVRDLGGKFRIQVQALDWQLFHDFLPVGVAHRPLCALVRFTLRDPLDYDLSLSMRREDIRDLRIGEQNPCRLGWTSWLGRDAASGTVTLSAHLV